MTDLFILQENFPKGYDYDVLHVISLISIICGISVILSKNPIVSVLFLTGLFLGIATFIMVLGLNFLDFSHLLVYVCAVSILLWFTFRSTKLRTSELAIDYTNIIPLAIIIGIIYLGLLFDMFDHKVVAHTSTISIIFAIRYITTRKTTYLQVCIALLLITVLYAIVYDIYVMGLWNKLDYTTELFILLLFIVILSYAVMCKFDSNKYDWIFTLIIRLIMLLVILFALYLQFKYGVDLAYAEELPYSTKQISTFYTHFNTAMKECIDTGVGKVDMDWIRFISFDDVMSKKAHFYETSSRILRDILVQKIGAAHTHHTAVQVYPDGTVIPSPILMAVRSVNG